MKAGAHLSQVPARTDWATPWPLFNKYDGIHHFTLDVCATWQNRKCRRYFAPPLDFDPLAAARNGLLQDWSSDVCWMNPPFGREITLWMAKAYGESQRGATVVCLVPARTCTQWWHRYAEKGEYEFIEGRIKFVGAEHNAPFPCAIIVFRPPYRGVA